MINIYIMSEKTPKSEEDKMKHYNESLYTGIYEILKEENYNKDSVNSKTEFYFYSQSADNKAGEGKNEIIDENEKDLYKDLPLNFRKILSNFYEPKNKIYIDNTTWKSVEHYYQANKFKNNNVEYYNKFHGNGEFADLSSEEIKSKGGKKSKIKEWEDFKFIKEQIMKIGQYEKIKQDKVSQEVLLNTHNAKLIHILSRQKKEKYPVFHNLMHIRQLLQNDKINKL